MANRSTKSSLLISAIKRNRGCVMKSEVNKEKRLLVSNYREAYSRGTEARISKRYKSWEECSDETSFTGLSGFIDGFLGRRMLYSWVK